MPLLTILMLVFFMCLMAAPSRVFGSAAFLDSIPESAIRPLKIGDTVPERDLERFPMVKYDPDLSQVKGLVIGDRIPDYLWDLPLWVVNHPNQRDTITLREYQDDKLLVLDFWARWCAPCVRSVDKWEGYVQQFGDGLSLVTVHMDYDHKALPFAHGRGWRSPVVIGEGAWIANRHFFTYGAIARVVWIADGKLLAITGTLGDDSEEILGVLDGRPMTITSHLEGSYQALERRRH